MLFERLLTACHGWNVMLRLVAGAGAVCLIAEGGVQRGCGRVRTPEYDDAAI